MLSTLATSLTHFLFPSLCVQCKVLIPPSSKVFCNDCSKLLELIHPEERCYRCFGLRPHSNSLYCENCDHKTHPLIRAASAFDYLGPAGALVREFKYKNRPYLGSGMAAFMVAQLIHLNWPLPDVIVPVPLSINHWFKRGYNQSLILADHMSELLNIPVVQLLGRRSGGYSQATVSSWMRKNLHKNTFYLKDLGKVPYKRLLIVDDVMTTGATLNRCAEVLCENNSVEIYALTFCRTLI